MEKINDMAKQDKYEILDHPENYFFEECGICNKNMWIDVKEVNGHYVKNAIWSIWKWSINTKWKSTNS